MSAIVGGCGTAAAHLLADAATIDTTTGALWSIDVKSTVGRGGVAFAGMGSHLPHLRFAHLAYSMDLDAVIDAAPALWAEALAPLSVAAHTMPKIVLFAGWSQRNARLEMHLLREVDGEFGFERRTAYVAGPAEGGAPLAVPYYKRFSESPNAFDPRDGVELMDTLRRHNLRDYAVGKRPAVGGFASHIVVRRESIETEIIDCWPADVIGKPIDVDATAPARARPPMAIHAPWHPAPPTVEEIAYLLRHPQIWREFDKDFGSGVADWFLQSYGYQAGWHGGPLPAAAAVEASEAA